MEDGQSLACSLYSVGIDPYHRSRGSWAVSSLYSVTQPDCGDAFNSVYVLAVSVHYHREELISA